VTDPRPVHGELAHVAERLVVAPAAGLFRPHNDDVIGAMGEPVARGQQLGVIEAPGSSTPVHCPFEGQLMGMLAKPGERLREGQPIAWLRVA
jgi:biotin carboxyl carrier protein